MAPAVRDRYGIGPELISLLWSESVSPLPSEFVEFALLVLFAVPVPCLPVARRAA